MSEGWVWFLTSLLFGLLHGHHCILRLVVGFNVAAVGVRLRCRQHVVRDQDGAGGPVAGFGAAGAVGLRHARCQHERNDHRGLRQAVTKAIAARYKQAGLVEKRTILDELCGTTGWHRNHARKALGQGFRPSVVRPRRLRVPRYGADVVAGLRFCWVVLGAPTGTRLAPVMGELVATLRCFGELDVSDEVAAALQAMSAATIDRWLAPDRAVLRPRGRSHTKPGSLLTTPHHRAERHNTVSAQKKTIMKDRRL